MKHRSVVGAAGAGGALVGLALALSTMAAAGQSNKALQDAVTEVQILLDEHYGQGAQLEEAGRLLDQVLQEDPAFAPAYVQMARLTMKGGHIRNGRFSGGALERAEQMLLRAGELDPKYPDTFSLLGNLYAAAGRLEEAAAALDTARRLGSMNPWTKVNLAEVYMKQKKHPDAQMAMFAVLMDARTDTAQQRNAYIAALEKRRTIARWAGDYDLVRKLGQKAVAVAAPHDAWTLGNYANDLVGAGDFDGAIAQARAALERMDYGVGRETLAHALYGKWAELSKAGKPDAAETLFAEAVQLRPDLEHVAKRFDSPGLKHLTDVRDRLLERARTRNAPKASP